MRVRGEWGYLGFEEVLFRCDRMFKLLRLCSFVFFLFWLVVEGSRELGVVGEGIMGGEFSFDFFLGWGRRELKLGW